MAHNQENAGSNPASATMNFKMYCELYDFTLYVCIGKPDAAMRTYLKPIEKYGYNHDVYVCNESGFTGSFETFLRGTTGLLWVGRAITDPEAHGILAHEIMHATFAILRRSGMKFSQKSEEAYTYLAEWITEKIYRKILKQ